MTSRVGVLFLLLINIFACRQLESPDDFVARVGDSYLLSSDIEASLSDLAIGIDTVRIRSQIISQWINTELLYQEALRRNLSDNEDIKLRLEESARAVLIEGIISEYHSQADQEIMPNDIAKYYEQNQEHLRFFEPFVYVRHLSSPVKDSVETVMELMNQNLITDSVFATLIERFSTSPTERFMLMENYFQENRLFLDQPELADLLKNTQAGSPPQLVQIDSLYHVIQVVDRSHPDSIPELPWIEDFIREQLSIRFRKQNYTRSVQSLRVNAEFREEIEIR
ncbi:MAG: hypothetical protein OXE92_06300 [Bacteroidetes bacterium]|nr:hypothetical protein [Bacteroidota bacterium]MCY4205319.1 hypothetical protein [Bacteroidota bacterium]